MVYLDGGILFSKIIKLKSKKINTHRNMHESQSHYAEIKKPENGWLWDGENIWEGG